MKSNLSVTTRRLLGIVFFFLLIPGINTINSWAAEIENPDKPANGQWDFKPQKTWTVEEAGEKSFASIRGVYVFDDGTVIAHDGKHKVFFLFSPDGKFVKEFGKQGEGPGEIKRLEHISGFIVDDVFIVADDNKVLYFSKDGKFIKSYKNQTFERRPYVFLDQERFLTAPLLARPGKKSEVRMVNLKTGDVKLIAEFEAFKGGTVQDGKMTVSVAIGGLTPMMYIGFGSGRVYYGMSDQYRIQVSEPDGKKLGEFSVDREARKVPLSEIKKNFKISGNIPEGMLKKIIDQLPDKEVFFKNIEVVDGLVYFYNASFNIKHTQKFDIFSLDGKYLYSGAIKVDEGSKLNTVKFRNGFLYMSIEDEEGNHSVNKYKISLPSI